MHSLITNMQYAAAHVNLNVRLIRLRSLPIDLGASKRVSYANLEHSCLFKCSVLGQARLSGIIPVVLRVYCETHGAVVFHQCTVVATVGVRISRISWTVNVSICGLMTAMLVQVTRPTFNRLLIHEENSAVIRLCEAGSKSH